MCTLIIIPLKVNSHLSLTETDGDVEGLTLGLDVGLEVTGVEGEELGNFEGFRDGDNVGYIYKEERTPMGLVTVYGELYLPVQWYTKFSKEKQLTETDGFFEGDLLGDNVGLLVGGAGNIY